MAWWGGQVGSAGARGAYKTSADSGVMKLDNVIERDSQTTNSGAVFFGTAIPVSLFFEFLEDYQTIDTFLDQFPMVSRDQARAVLGASRDMLLGAARSEV